jgi:hypothetical protein
MRLVSGMVNVTRCLGLRKDTLLTIYKKKDYEKLKYCPAVKFRNIEAYSHLAPHSAEFGQAHSRCE